MKNLLILIIMFFPTIAFGAWNEEKTAREIVFCTVLINDWSQTLVIADTPWRKEKNKILGSKPHRDNVNIYFAGCLIGHALIAYVLPDNYANIWQSVWIGIESNSINNNMARGHTLEINSFYKVTHTIKF